MAEQREREMRFERRMSDAEALMWNVEKDPWLNPNGANVAIVDRPIDADLFLRRVRYAVAKIPRLRERVVAGVGRLSPPVWMPDPEFDFDYHVRHISLPEPGTRRQLFDLATRFYEDPYDRTRPLWLFVLIDGLEGGRAALFSKFHHTVSDGISAMRISEMYIERGRDAEAPPDVDLDSLVAQAVATQEGGDDADAEDHDSGTETPSGAPSSFVAATSASVAHILRRQAGITRRSAAEMASWATSPTKAMDAGEKAINAVRSAVGEVRGGGGDVRGGSPLWGTRSRRRHLESLRVPLEALKSAGAAMGGSINDMFVTGAVNGALRYHAERDVTVEALNISFVVSTRTDKAIGGNSFSPTRVQIPGGPMTVEERLADVRDRMAAKRSGSGGGGGGGSLASLAGIANLLPTSVMTRAARSQVTKVDFATSNLRGAKVPLYISGAKILENITMGPVAGTAFNLTTISYNGSLDIGAFIDPVAVQDPDDLRRCLEEAYAELAGPSPRRRKKGK